MRILAIAGSLRQDSHNRKLLHEAIRLGPDRWIVDYYEDLARLPAFNEDDEGEPVHDAVTQLRQAVVAADGLVFSTPEYNSSVPGALKNAIDWLSRPFSGPAIRGKSAVVVGASTGAFGAVWAQAELRKVLAAAGARVVEAEVPVGHAHEQFDADGHLHDESLRTAVQDAMGSLDEALSVAAAIAAH